MMVDFTCLKRNIIRKMVKYVKPYIIYYIDYIFAINNHKFKNM